MKKENSKTIVIEDYIQMCHEETPDKSKNGIGRIVIWFEKSGVTKVHSHTKGKEDNLVENPEYAKAKNFGNGKKVKVTKQDGQIISFCNHVTNVPGLKREDVIIVSTF